METTCWGLRPMSTCLRLYDRPQLLFFSYSTWLKSRQKMQSHSIYARAKFKLDSSHSKRSIVGNIFHVRNNYCLTNHKFFDYCVASFASPHSRIRHSEVIGCRQHGRHDHGSISTLMTKLLRKQWILNICTVFSDCKIGHNFCISYSIRLKYRHNMQSHSNPDPYPNPAMLSREMLL